MSSTTVKDAAAAIVALINSSPRSPRQEEIEAVLAKYATSVAVPATPLLAKIRDIAARLDEAFDAYGKVNPGDIIEARAQARIDQLEGELESLEGQIPSPPRSFADLMAWAEIARSGADIRKDGTMAETTERDVFARPAARLIEAVLQFPGATSMASMSPAHAAHYREWRGLMEAHLRQFDNVDETGMTKAEVNAEEERMAAHLETMDALADRVFAVPARAWGDIVLFAELCWWAHLAGFDPEGPNAPSELRNGFAGCSGERLELTIAKLLEAIFTVAGVGQFAETGSG